MTNIVKRLRQGIERSDEAEAEAAMDKAADEIERLRAEVAGLKASNVTLDTKRSVCAGGPEMTDIVERLRLAPLRIGIEHEAADEIERLRAVCDALRAMIRMKQDGP
jgi:low affinity Fe/Cu permease